MRFSTVPLIASLLAPLAMAESCSPNGIQKCNPDDKASFEVCLDGEWLDINCYDKTVCVERDGLTGCFPEALAKNEPCPIIGEQKCSADHKSFGTCDYSGWVWRKCPSGNTCVQLPNSGPLFCSAPYQEI